MVMDNVPLHRTRAVREALEAHGVSVPEFPAYSPDLNPIEQPIGKLKAFLRKLGPRSLRHLISRHAGYGQPNRNLVSVACSPNYAKAVRRRRSEQDESVM